MEQLVPAFIALPAPALVPAVGSIHIAAYIGGAGAHGWATGGVPLNLVQRWLGHADIATTTIYADVMGA